MEEDNNKEWIVSRIDQLHQNILEQFRLEQEKLQNDAEVFYEPFRQARNYIIFGLLISSIALFGSRWLSIINDLETLISTIGTGIVAGVVYYIVNRIHGYYEEPLESVINSYVAAQNKINHSLINFNMRTLDLDKVSIEFLNKAANSTIKLALEMKGSLLESIKKALQKKLPKKIKKYLDEKVITLERELEGSRVISKSLDEESGKFVEFKDAK